MAWKPTRRKSNWRDFLTAEEAAIFRRIDRAEAKVAKARAEYDKFARERNLIQNRAIQRSKFTARKAASERVMP